eukprot:6195211-Pleurochrysis_carterae.AAC.1
MLRPSRATTPARASHSSAPETRCGRRATACKPWARACSCARAGYLLAALVLTLPAYRSSQLHKMDTGCRISLERPPTLVLCPALSHS